MTTRGTEAGTGETEALETCPSPWCDHAAFVASTDNDYFWGEAYQGRCTQCGLGGPVKKTRAEAVEAWNDRPTHIKTEAEQ